MNSLTGRLQLGFHRLPADQDGRMSCTHSAGCRSTAFGPAPKTAWFDAAEQGTRAARQKLG